MLCTQLRNPVEVVVRVLMRNSCRVMVWSIITRNFDASEDSLGTLAECGEGVAQPKARVYIDFF